MFVLLAASVAIAEEFHPRTDGSEMTTSPWVSTKTDPSSTRTWNLGFSGTPMARKDPSSF